MQDGTFNQSGTQTSDTNFTDSLNPIKKFKARILSADFVYVPSSSTDVQKTWMRLTDWKPRS
jgi:hypothetical protein